MLKYFCYDWMHDCCLFTIILHSFGNSWKINNVENLCELNCLYKAFNTCFILFQNLACRWSECVSINFHSKDKIENCWMVVDINEMNNDYPTSNLIEVECVWPALYLLICVFVVWCFKNIFDNLFLHNLLKNMKCI